MDQVLFNNLLIKLTNLLTAIYKIEHNTGSFTQLKNQWTGKNEELFTRVIELEEKKLKL